MKLRIVFLALLGWAHALADDSTDGRAALDKARQAYAQEQFPEALARFDAAEKAARAAGDTALLLDGLRLRASAERDSGDAASASQTLRKAAGEAAQAYGDNSPELAGVLEEIAAGNRAEGHADQALAAVEKAIQIRDAQTGAARAGLARDLTLAAALDQQAGKVDSAIELLKRAVQEWSLGQPGDPQSLPAIEALAEIYRDRSQYADAEPLLRRAVHMRAAASGRDSAELIPAVDSLAYVEFGLQKYVEAEALYNRLLGLWAGNAGQDHPMVALTLDKMAEFYSAQQRYAEAEKVAYEALSIRAKTFIASLNQTGRVLLMDGKLEDAEDLYRRTVQIGDQAKAPDEVMDPPLRIYAELLRKMKRDEDAAAVDQRIKAALLRKADREGRRPAPIQVQPQ
jgi:hypothetical protein